MNDYQNKKEQFTNPQKSKFPFFIFSGIAVVAVIVAIILIATKSDDKKGNYYGEPVVEARSYMGELISMTTISPELKDGAIVFPLEEVSKNNIVYFEFENNDKEVVSLMAYITPSGRIFAGSSLCEPCRGRKFSLAGETLVCDTCKTTYNIEDHEFLSGVKACGKFPPVNMNPKVEAGNVIIDFNEVLNWKIRG